MISTPFVPPIPISVFDRHDTRIRLLPRSASLDFHIGTSVYPPHKTRCAKDPFAIVDPGFTCLSRFTA